MATLRLLKGSQLLPIALLLLAAPAWAGPPFVTDDPEPVDYQHYEAYIVSEQSGTIGGHTTTNLVELNYGLMPDVQISMSVPYVIDSPAGQLTQQGMGDVVFGVKYRFQQETDNRPMMAFYPVVTVATGNTNKGLGNGGVQYFLPVWMQKSWDDWHFFGGGGYWVNRAPGGASHWYFGAGALNDVTEHFSFGGEVYHATDQRPLENSSNGFTIGGAYKINENNKIVFSAGRAVVEISSQNSYSTYIGYGVSW